MALQKFNRVECWPGLHKQWGEPVGSNMSKLDVIKLAVRIHSVELAIAVARDMLAQKAQRRQMGVNRTPWPATKRLLETRRVSPVWPSAGLC